MGDGGFAAEILTAAGVQWHTARDEDFDGTTILPINKQVNRHNDLVLARLPGKAFKVSSRRWGKQRPEWGLSRRTNEWGVPPVREFKVGATVMILANAPDFSYVNGDGGHVDRLDDRHAGPWTSSLFRTGPDGRRCRRWSATSASRLSRTTGTTSARASRRARTTAGGTRRPHYRGKARRYVTGQLEYLPVTIGYASTVHKSQSLTLDRIQVDVRHAFFGAPAMTYVALSRVRSLAGLRIVGQREVFVKRANVDREVLAWL